MSRRQLVVVFATLLPLFVVCQAQTPITWPDPRRFTIKMEETEIVYSWDEVTSSSPDNEVYSLWVEQTEVASGKTETREEPSSQITMDIKSGRVKYTAVARLKTRFNPDGVYANISFYSPHSRSPYYQGPSHRTVNVRTVGEGPFVVAMNDKPTRECVILVYDESSSSTIETTDACKNSSRLMRVIYARFEVQPTHRPSVLRDYAFEMETDLLDALPPQYDVVARPAPHQADFELDPPADVDAVVKLKTPTVGVILLRFLPPMSNVRLISKFTFVVSQSKANISLYVSDIEGSTDLTRRQVSEAQKRLEYFELEREITLDYPSNYTVTAYTNGAVKKRAVFPIIMPNINALHPTVMKAEIVDNNEVKLYWKVKNYFGGRCNVEALAKPADEGDKQAAIESITLSSTNQIENRVTFKNLSLAVNYTFRLLMNCSDYPPFTTATISMVTAPVVPEPPTNLRMSLLNSTTANLTWDEPAVPANTQVEYEVTCTLKHTRYGDRTWKALTNFLVFRDLTSEPMECKVIVIAKINGSKVERRSRESLSVILEVPHGGLPTAPPVKIVGLNASAVEIDLMGEHQLDVAFFQVSLDDAISFDFLLDSADPTAGFNITGESSVVVTRTNRTQFVLSNLVPHNTYKVTVVTHFFVNHSATNTYEVKLTPPAVAMKQETQKISEKANTLTILLPLLLLAILVAVGGVGVSLLIRCGNAKMFMKSAVHEIPSFASLQTVAKETTN